MASAEPILIFKIPGKLRKREWETVTNRLAGHKFCCISDFQFLASSDRYRPDIIIPEIFIIKCNLVCKKFWIKAQCQTTKRNKNVEARIKSCNKWFVDRIGIYPRPQRVDWAQSSQWLARAGWQLFIGDTGQSAYLGHWIKIKSGDI